MPEPVRRFLGIARAKWLALAFFILARAREPGTIRQVLVALSTLFGVRIAPEMAETIAWLGLAAAVAIGVLTDEHRGDGPPPPEGQA